MNDTNENKKEEYLRYHNDLNDFAFVGLTARELDILFSLFRRVSGRKNSIVKIPFSTIYSFTNAGRKFPLDLANQLEVLKNKLAKGTYSRDECVEYRTFFFDKFTINRDEAYIEISVSNNHSYLFNDISGNFSLFPLSEEKKLTTRYSKLLYKKLIQYKGTGSCFLSLEEMKWALDIPKSYSTNKIIHRIIKPAVNELNEKTKMKGLTVTPFSPSNRKITRLDFSFTYQGSELTEKEQEDLAQFIGDI